MRELELYIHIPFCVKKCNYCDFLSAPATGKEQEDYVRLLLEEIRKGKRIRTPEAYTVTSVFFGGGTPSLLEADQIAEIMAALRASFRFENEKEPEVTIECNPGTIDRKKLAGYRSCGINRISFGVQSANRKELALLGRIHTWETFLESYKLARDAGFTNINLDLIFALPHQSAASWEKTLRQALALRPEHISAYSLMIEEGTPFYAAYHEDDLRREKGKVPKDLPSEEEEREMAALSEALLEDAGLHRYEISNYARDGYACRHNIGYWTGREYLGLGLGASSYLHLDGEEEKEASWVRLKNPSEVSAYAQMLRGKEKPEQEILSEEDRMAEFMFLGLRMRQGVSERDFKMRFGIHLEEVYGETVARLIRLGLLAREEKRIFLTPRGTELSNPVMAEFLL